MTRTDFLSFLVRSVEDGFISEEEGAALLQRFDAGDIAPDALPLPLFEAIPTEEQIVANEDYTSGAALLLALALGLPGLSALRAAPASARETWQDTYADGAAAAATLLATGAAVRSWHRVLMNLLGGYHMGQAYLGAGAVLTGSALRGVAGRIRENFAFLSRFAEEVSARLLTGRPLSVEAITARSELYSGAGRAEWFRQNESVSPGVGFVCDYESRDDKGTCRRCLDAENGSPYLPGIGPFPGTQCRGRGRCRCRRVTRYAPEEYRRLTAGQTIAA